MKLIVEATVAGKSQVLADGLVRVHVTRGTDGAVVGRLSLTAELWEWVRDWAQAAGDMGVIGPGMGAEIEIREHEHSAASGKRAETMRGRLLEAAGEAAARAEGSGEGKGTGNAPTSQDEAPGQGQRKHGIGGLYRQVQMQASKKGKYE